MNYRDANLGRNIKEKKVGGTAWRRDCRRDPSGIKNTLPQYFIYHAGAFDVASRTLIADGAHCISVLNSGACSIMPFSGDCDHAACLFLDRKFWSLGKKC